MTVLQGVPVARIGARAARIEFAPTALALIAGLLWLIGFLVGKLARGLWLIVAYVAASVMTGWDDAQGAVRAS